MEYYIEHIVPSLLGCSAILLGILIPGGPVEKRDFSHISPMVLGTFNAFLTVLGIGSLVLVYFSLIGSKMAFMAAVFCGISYFLVYFLDLGKIFPVSPNKMPRTLFWIEVIGFILSIPLTVFALIYIFMTKEVGSVYKISSNATIVGLVVLIILLGVGVVVFATKSAMRKSPNQANPPDKPQNRT